jgi:hypothetical protein
MFLMPISAEKYSLRDSCHRNRLCFPCLPAGRFVPFFAQAKKGSTQANKRRESGPHKNLFAVAIFSLTFSLNEPVIAHGQQMK